VEETVVVIISNHAAITANLVASSLAANRATAIKIVIKKIHVHFSKVIVDLAIIINKIHNVRFKSKTLIISDK
jgi:hypothetical protein